MRRLVLFVALFLAIAAPALAHVEVTPESAPKGGSATFTFNVEDEQDNANMVKVEFFLPNDASTHLSGPAGWTAEGSGTFTHAAPGPQGDQSFTIKVDALPNTERLIVKTVVTYDNGEVDRWIDEPTEGDEPPHPAPVITLTGGGQSTTTSPETHISTPPVKKDKGSNKAGIALVICLAAVVVTGLGVYANRGSRDRGA